MRLRSIFRGITGRIEEKKQPAGEERSHCGLGLGGCSRNKQTPSSQESSSIWANLPPELLLDIISRIEADDTTWPSRRSVVACGGVCKTWRSITREITRTPLECGLFTFPISLKQPGTRDSPVQCFIKRDRATSTFRLYLGFSPALAGNSRKFLLAAKRIRKATRTDFLISLAADEFSQSSDTYVGRLRSNFLGSKFYIHDSQIPSNSSIQSSGWSWKRIFTNRVSPRPPVCSYNLGTITYELNVLRTRGPRRIRCVVNRIPVSPTGFGLDGTLSEAGEYSSPSEIDGEKTKEEALVLENKVPRWHDQLQCWCLNFRGRVTIASVKNFQLVAASSRNGASPEDEKVLLQFGKIGKDIFTMDYQYPLSAFQAFAICLSSFDTKPACE